ncbi:MAG: universal stress protein [Acidimicrobiia bacterium]|nr:universal stress protein [Acidimicrobiia bacterium]
MSVVVGFVDRPEGEAAFDLAIRVAKHRETDLVLVHSLKGGTSDSIESAEVYARKLDEMDRRLTEEGVEHTVKEYVRGNEPVEDLVRAAAEFEADLIVIGIRRRSQTGKLLLGSNATDILFNAPCPVLTVRANSLK